MNFHFVIGCFTAPTLVVLFGNHPEVGNTFAGPLPDLLWAVSHRVHGG